MELAGLKHVHAVPRIIEEHVMDVQINRRVLEGALQRFVRTHDVGTLQEGRSIKLK